MWNDVVERSLPSERRRSLLPSEIVRYNVTFIRRERIRNKTIFSCTVKIRRPYGID